MAEGNKFNPEKNPSKESIQKDIDKELAVNYRALADHYEGKKILNEEDLMIASKEIKFLMEELWELEK